MAPTTAATVPGPSFSSISSELASGHQNSNVEQPPPCPPTSPCASSLALSFENGDAMHALSPVAPSALFGDQNTPAPDTEENGENVTPKKSESSTHFPTDKVEEDNCTPNKDQENRNEAEHQQHIDTSIPSVDDFFPRARAGIGENIPLHGFLRDGNDDRGPSMGTESMPDAKPSSSISAQETGSLDTANIDVKTHSQVTAEE